MNPAIDGSPLCGATSPSGDLLCAFSSGHSGRHGWESADGQWRFRSVEHYLIQSGWVPCRTQNGLGWKRGVTGPLAIHEAREMQMRDDEDAGWVITGLTLEKPGVKP